MEETIFEEESSVTVRGYRHRTTIPRGIFKYLNLKDKDKLLWKIHRNGQITVVKK